MHLGEIVKQYRESHNLSMSQFSIRSGLSKAYIGMLEQNKNPSTGKAISPTIDVVRKIAKAINMNFNDLTELLNDDQISNNITPLNESKKLIFGTYFTDPAKALDYLKNGPCIMVEGGSNLDKMTDEKILEFANGIIYLSELTQIKEKPKKNDEIYKHEKCVFCSCKKCFL